MLSVLRVIKRICYDANTIFGSTTLQEEGDV